VKHLVQLHQGDIEVKSEGIDKGATFIVSFPCAAAAPSRAIDNARNRGPGNDGLPVKFSTLLKQLRILVVDDEPDTCDLLVAILTRCGSEVKCCESAAEAIKAVRNWKPDLLVSDIGMPNEDGYSLIEKLRKSKSKQAREIPAIALTAYATNDDRERALAAGFQLHVAKPVDPEMLVRSVATTVGRKIK